MSSSPTEPRSIASQLVVLFAVAAALLLFCGLAVLYWIVVRHAFGEDNEVLADKVATLQADLERAGSPGALQQELATARGGERITYLVRILHANGETAAETPAMGELLPSDVFPDPTQSTTRSAGPVDYRARARLFSLVTASQETGGQRYTLQVAQDRTVDEHFMRQFAALVAVVLVIGIFAAAAIAITVTRRGLRPLGRMTESLRRVGPRRLHERLTAAGWPRELQPLAATFDQMLDRLEDSFTRLSQFSADLAHELRTPIANIRGECEVALTRSRTAEEYRDVVESTVAECERLSRVIDSLLFLARAEAAERHITRSTFDGRAALEKIIDVYETVADEHRVTLRITGEATVVADPLLFGRAVSNLVDNALRFTPPGGEIAIAVRSRSGGAEITVSDTGAGIAAEHLPRVFDRFYRVDRSRSSEGTGLGLALVKSIADLHGGTATITSVVGRGTKVTLLFPNEGDASAEPRGSVT